MEQSVVDVSYSSFFDTLKKRVEAARYQAALRVNQELILLYHHIGAQILKSQSEHGWGAKIIDQLSKDLKATFPDMKGFSPRNLKYMRKFAEKYPEAAFVQQVAAQLPWFHIAVILDKIKNRKHQVFYFEKTIEHGWSRSMLISQIEKALHARQGQSINNFNSQLPSPLSGLAHETLKDPYILIF
jgi:predicted nuclease of restriction endonuclease-like (RecB) superfamily